MSEPVNISPRIPRWSNQRPEYRTEGCLPASLAASPRLKKPRKETTATEKKGKEEGTTGERRKGEKNCANGLGDFIRAVWRKGGAASGRDADYRPMRFARKRGGRPAATVR